MSDRKMQVGRLTYRFSYTCRDGSECWEHLCRGEQFIDIFKKNSKWHTTEYGYRGRVFRDPLDLLRTVHSRRQSDLEKSFAKSCARLAKFNPDREVAS